MFIFKWEMQEKKKGKRESQAALRQGKCEKGKKK